MSKYTKAGGPGLALCSKPRSVATLFPIHALVDGDRSLIIYGLQPSVKAVLVHCDPWSVLNISGRAFSKA
jgi:hypothetical protein